MFGTLAAPELAERFPKSVNMIASSLELFFPTLFMDWKYVAAVCVAQAIETGEMASHEELASAAQSTEDALGMVTMLTRHNENVTHERDTWIRRAENAEKEVERLSSQLARLS